MIIKLCGITREEDIQAVNRLQPDFIGFVFYPPSRRYILPDRAKELKTLLDPRIQAVGVFVNENPETIGALLEEGVIDLAQLHGQETASDLRVLRRLTGQPLIQAFRIQDEQDLFRAEESEADYILLDSGMGTGQPFNWDLLSRARRPYWLAGGLRPENAAEAVTRLRPAGLDVSSGIETNGLKDPAKMRTFMKNARQAEKQII